MKKDKSKFFMSQDVLALFSLVFIVLLVGVFSVLFQSGFFNGLHMSRSSHVQDTSIQDQSSLAGQAITTLTDNSENSDGFNEDVFCSELEKMYSIQEKPLDEFYFSQCS